MCAADADVVMSSLACPNAVILGDAAHATSPQLGQGANLALVDAWVLGECLGGRPSKEVAESLAAYAARRRGRLLWHQFNSRLITPVFQSNSALIGSARDLLMPLCCRFPPTQYHVSKRVTFLVLLTTSCVALCGFGHFRCWL